MWEKSVMKRSGGDKPRRYTLEQPCILSAAGLFISAHYCLSTVFCSLFFSAFPPGRRCKPLWAGGRLPTSEFKPFPPSVLAVRRVPSAVRHLFSHLLNFSPSQLHFSPSAFPLLNSNISHLLTFLTSHLLSFFALSVSTFHGNFFSATAVNLWFLAIHLKGLLV